MRTIERTTQFRRDYRREARGRHRATLDNSLTAIMLRSCMIRRSPSVFAITRFRGEWAGFRDCHVKPDLVLIYEKPDDETLRLVRLGSHSELGW